MKQDGNVIEVAFGKPRSTLQVSASYEQLYCDQYVCLGRIVYVVGDRTFIQHVMTEVKTD